VDILDGIIIALGLGFFVAGCYHGLVWETFSVLGLIAGAVVGAVLAPPITRFIAPQGGHGTQPLIATAAFLACLLLVQAVGSFIGRRLRAQLHFPPVLHRAEQAGGGVIGAAGLLMVVWFLGFTFSSSTLTVISQQFQGSWVEQNLAGLAPQPPAFLTGVQQFLRDSSLPAAFAGIAPVLQAQALPLTVATPGIQGDGAQVLKVAAYGCEGNGGYVAGSGFPIGPHLVLTNAHVVAGSTSQQVFTPTDGVQTAWVVLFDPDEDVAVLYLPNLSLPPLAVVETEIPVGTQGAALGYPRGGGEMAAPAAVEGTVTASGLNIYSSAYVSRPVLVLTGEIIPGDSGGPVVNLAGQVVGVTFATSTTQPDEGYALGLAGVLPDIQAAQGLSRPISTEECLQG
jgi:S1-C subfamily serine protease